MKELRRWRPAVELTRAVHDVVMDLVERFAPDVIAYEMSYYVQQEGSRLLAAEERQIRRTAKAAGLRVVGYSPLYVRQSLCGDAYSTERQVAAKLVHRFPELARYRANHAARRERYWLNMFDALAVATVAAREFRTPDSSSVGDARAA